MLTISPLWSGLSQMKCSREACPSAYQHGFAQKWGRLHSRNLDNRGNMRGKNLRTILVINIEVLWKWQLTIHINRPLDVGCPPFFGEKSPGLPWTNRPRSAANPVPRSEVKAVKARNMRQSTTCIKKWSESTWNPQKIPTVTQKNK
jgi:hypothetical protein